MDNIKKPRECEALNYILYLISSFRYAVIALFEEDIPAYFLRFFWCVSIEFDCLIFPETFYRHLIFSHITPPSALLAEVASGLLVVLFLMQPM